MATSLRRISAWAWLAAIVVGSAVFRAILTRGIVAPFVMVYEVIWSELARREHNLDRVADLYAAALEEAAGGPAVGDAVLREVSRAAADVGISADTSEAQEIARRLAEVELGN